MFYVPHIVVYKDQWIRLPWNCNKFHVKDLIIFMSDWEGNDRGRSSMQICTLCSIMSEIINRRLDGFEYMLC